MVSHHTILSLIIFLHQHFILKLMWHTKLTHFWHLLPYKYSSNIFLGPLWKVNPCRNAAIIFIQWVVFNLILHNIYFPSFLSTNTDVTYVLPLHTVIFYTYFNFPTKCCTLFTFFFLCVKILCWLTGTHAVKLQLQSDLYFTTACTLWPN